MKKLLLSIVSITLLTGCSILKSLPAIEPGSTTTTPPATGSGTPTAQVATMDPSLESSMINQITSAQYAPIDTKIKTLNNLLNRAKNLDFISQAVQANYFAAINKIFSDLMAATKKESSVYIRQFISLLNSCLSTSILDVNQKNFVRSYALQLKQQLQNITQQSQKSEGKGQTRQVGKLR